MSVKKNAAQTSNADKVIDAISEVRNKEKKPGYACNSCGSGSFTPRRALGGPLIRVCNACGSKDVGARGRGLSFLSDKNLNHGQGKGRGPTAKTLSKQTSVKKDKFQPTYRKKGKSRE